MYRQILFMMLACVTLLSANAAEDEREAMNAAYREYQEIMAKGVSARADAIEPAARAYELSKRVYGNAHQTTAALAINYGNVLQNRAEAVQILNEGLMISEAVHGKDGIDLIDPLMALADASTDLRDLDGARRYYSRALQIALQHEEKDSFLEGVITLSLGVTNYNDNKRLESIRQFRAAREILAKHDTTMAKIRLATAELWIGTHQIVSGRHKEAIEPLLASLALFNSFPETRFTALTNYKMLVEAYEALGMRDEATPHALAMGAITMTEPVLLYEVQPTLGRVRTPGLAQVSFTVDEQGYPRDATVVSAADQRFGETALETIVKMRYAPRFVDGVAVASPGVVHTFSFRPSR
jgi:TonB family protein